MNWGRVTGVSMWPVLREDFSFRYKKINPSHIEIGDLFVFSGTGRRGEPRTIVHRAIGRVGPYLLEAGDNSFSASLVHDSQVLGVVVEVFDLSGRALKSSEIKRRVLSKRFHVFNNMAGIFLYVHELKDRALGNRKSFILWKASEWYRSAWKTLGLHVPSIPPRSG